MPQITQIIEQKLNDVEEAENVRIIHCVESGSRAWGFASPDSDYDVRFIYVRPKEFYLRLDRTSDVIEWELNDTLDINGWDLKKALTLLMKSNPTLFEWNNSPIVYRTTPEWRRVAEVINDYFRTKAGLYHYLSTAGKNYREYLQGDTVKLKKYFYVLRPILACRWIIDRNCPPPMLFSRLAENYLDKSVEGEVAALLGLKMNSPELGEGRRIDKLNAYIESSLDELQAILSALPDDGRRGRDSDTLNKLFIDIISS